MAQAVARGIERADGKAELARGRRLDRQELHAVGAAADGQLGHHAHAEAVADHADDGGIVHPGRQDVRLDADAVEDTHDVLIEALRGHDEVACLESGEREGGHALRVEILRQNGKHGIVGEMHPLVLALVLRGDEDGVHLALREQLVGDVDVVSHADIHVHVGALLAEALDDARQPVHGDAGVGADADDLRARGGDLLDHAVQAGVGLQKFAHGGRDALALLREAHAAASALKQREADLLFQRVHHVCQARLRVAEDLCRLGKAAEIDCHEQGL